MISFASINARYELINGSFSFFPPLHISHQFFGSLFHSLTSHLNFSIEKLILRCQSVTKFDMVKKVTIVKTVVLHTFLRNITRSAIITRKIIETLENLNWGELLKSLFRNIPTMQTKKLLIFFRMVEKKGQRAHCANNQFLMILKPDYFMQSVLITCKAISKIEKLDMWGENWALSTPPIFNFQFSQLSYVLLRLNA